MTADARAPARRVDVEAFEQEAGRRGRLGPHDHAADHTDHTGRHVIDARRPRRPSAMPPSAMTASSATITVADRVDEHDPSTMASAPAVVGFGAAGGKMWA